MSLRTLVTSAYDGPVQGEDSSALEAYEAFAPAYDAFTSRNDYEFWLSAAMPVLEQYGLTERGRLLDVGCGSGNSFLPMLQRGWTVTGCDLSPAMIELARGKVGEEVELFVCDMRELPALGEFELVWAIDDAVNYLLGDGDLERAVARMAANLSPAGLLVFDTNTLATYRTGFSARETSDRGGRTVVWNGITPEDVEPGSICAASIEGEGIETHVHRQRHYPETAVRAALESAGLRCLEAIGYDDEMNLYRPADEARAAKVLYVAAPADA